MPRQNTSRIKDQERNAEPAWGGVGVSIALVSRTSQQSFHCAESGNIIKWYGTNVDIEDRKRADEELRRSETFLAQALRSPCAGA